MEFPKFVDTLEAATALNVSPRTICRLVGKTYDKHNTRVPFLGLCRAVKADPAVLKRVVAVLVVVACLGIAAQELWGR